MGCGCIVGELLLPTGADCRVSSEPFKRPIFPSLLQGVISDPKQPLPYSVLIIAVLQTEMVFSLHHPKRVVQ